jgi:hypothetical protein
MFFSVRDEIVHRLAHALVALAAFHGFEKGVGQADQLAVVVVDRADAGMKIISPGKLRHDISLRQFLPKQCGRGFKPAMPLLTSFEKSCARTARSF